MYAADSPRETGHKELRREEHAERHVRHRATSCIRCSATGSTACIYVSYSTESVDRIEDVACQIEDEYMEFMCEREQRPTEPAAACVNAIRGHSRSAPHSSSSPNERGHNDWSERVQQH